MRRNKYNAKKTKVDGILFDSKKEAVRYSELKLLEEAGLIENLALQVNFELVPKTETERALNYRADFTYTEDGLEIVEDVKGKKTDLYIAKRKMFKYKYPQYVFREV